MVQTRVRTPHMKLNAFRLSFWGGDTAQNNCEDVHTRVGTPHKNMYSNVLTRVGTPHNFSRKKLMWSGGWLGGWLVAGGWNSMIILPLCGSILQAETCKILSLAENPRWSRVWQYCVSTLYCVLTLLLPTF